MPGMEAGGYGRMAEKLAELRRRLGEAADLHAAIGLMHWDQEVCMPPKGAGPRALQLATLSAVAHRAFTDPSLGALLRELAERRDALGEADRPLVDVALYDYERATKLPEEFVHEFAQTTSEAYEVWVKARAASDFSMFLPRLERIVELNRRKAEYLGYEGSPYNALLEDYERGMTAERLARIFGELAPKQAQLLERILASPNQPDVSWLEGDWDEQAQWEFGEIVLRDLGYDFDAGRQDKSVHPFSAGFARTDVRITTRFDARDPFSALMGTIHECGHALYSQGHDPEDDRTPLSEGASLGVHESQSRLWENIIGRSLPFWKHYLPRFRELFPNRIEHVAPEQVYAAINRVRPSLIRVEADECTYNLHVMLRFDIELALMEGTLRAAEVPQVWNEKVMRYLGLDVPDDANGCLQDIHWSHGSFGYFPTYALGNLYAAQLMEAIERAIPDLWSRVEAGDFASLLAWLREHVHRHGRRKLPVEVIVDATGEEPSAGPYLRYLERKYGELYRL